MNDRRRWHAVDPMQFDDGVLYLPDMIEIQPREPDWGLGGSIVDLLAKIDDDRPHGGKESDGKLLCLLCMALNARAGMEPAPIWMYFMQRNGLRLFCHIGSHDPHPEHEPESEEHKALVQREVRTCELVGASVQTEVRTAKGRRRADFIATGPEVTLAGEIQLSRVPRQRIGQRQRDLTSDGKRALWTTDSTRPDFLDGVPRLVIPALTGWQQALRDPELAIVAGWWLMEDQRCGWADAWNGGRPRCPCTGSPRPCGRIHAYPTRDAGERTYRPTSGPIMQFGAGGRPHLDLIVGGIVTGEWVPYKRKVGSGHQFEWIPAKDYERVIEERGGGDAGQAERTPGTQQALTSAERSCEARSVSQDAPVVVDSPPTPVRPPAVSPHDTTDDGPSPQSQMANNPSLASWADHPRWANTPRCTVCDQPMFVSESIELGVCARHRPTR